jgi:hypothetical protein
MLRVPEPQREGSGGGAPFSFPLRIDRGKVWGEVSKAFWGGAVAGSASHGQNRPQPREG